MIRARMRSGASWRDVCILNLSRRGRGIQAAETPARGTYVEICRGSCIVVARVMWAKGHRAGLHSQDAIAVRAIVYDEPVNDRGWPSALPKVERRRAPRTAQRFERRRSAGRLMEFAFAGLAALAFGFTAFGIVEQALAKPIAQVRKALDR